MIRGPKEKASMYMDRIIVPMVSEVCKSSFMVGMVGATIDDDNGPTTLKNETKTDAAHRRRMGQFRGFAGSSGPSQVTYAAVSPDLSSDRYYDNEMGILTRSGFDSDFSPSPFASAIICPVSVFS